MNPDFHDTHNTAETITWTLKDSEGNVVTFKVLNRLAPPQVEVVENSKTEGKSGKYLLAAARKMWDEYIRRGFRVHHKCINHDMKKFYDTKRTLEENNKKAMKSIHASMEDSVKSYKKQCAKKAYTEMWKNYALEA